MPGDEKHEYSAYDSLPIPTYEEATSSRPSSSQSLGPQEISDDAERQGLLGGGHQRNASGGASRRRDGVTYQAPTAESVRSSEETDLDLLEITPPSDDEEGSLRDEMEQLEIDDAEAGLNGRSRMRSTFSKRLSSLTTTLSSLHLPSLPRFRISLGSLFRRIPEIPDPWKPKWYIVLRLVGLFVIISVVYALFVIEILPMRRGVGQPFNPEWVRTYAQGSVDKDRIRDNLKYVTSYDHVAGTEGSYALAKYIEGRFQAAGMDELELERYYAYLNYPTKDGRSVSIVEPADLAWNATLEEDSVYGPPIPGTHHDHDQHQTLAFHGLSRGGSTKGPLIYANYGSKEDFEKLKKDGVDVKGAIVLVRYYGTQADRGLKVKAAELAGAAGCLIYSDPAEDGFVKGDVWPDGSWRPEDSLQRGTVALTSWIVGDVLTPGYASTTKSKRISKDENPALVNIPSLPLAWRDAQVLLQSLKGKGKKVPEKWIGGVPDVDDWWTGDQDSPVVSLRNEQDEVEKQKIYNVIGQIAGVETMSKKIIVGNHRDSWCYGAADPGSGTAVMLEVIDILAALLREGWRPLRSIVFASWDAEEYNLIGSTEWVEDHIQDVRDYGVAYLNVDVGVSGPDFFADASPIFGQTMRRVLDRVSDPTRNVTIQQLWDSNGQKLGNLGAGSDYVAFQDLAGTSSIDFGFRGEPYSYPYHSCYETFEWMTKYGDPELRYHHTLAEIWVLLILELSQEPILPFDMLSYSKALEQFIKDLEDYASSNSDQKQPLNTKDLHEASDILKDNTRTFDSWEDSWYAQVYGRGGFESTALGMQRLGHNGRLAQFDTDLLDLPKDEDDKSQHGIPGREQYKHILFGPSIQDGYDGITFPAVRDAIAAGDWKLAQQQVDKAAIILKKAAENLIL